MTKPLTPIDTCRLPLHLDVEKRDRVGSGEWEDVQPFVFCRILGCRWERRCEEEDLDLGAVDWHREHGEHG